MRLNTHSWAIAAFTLVFWVAPARAQLSAYSNSLIFAQDASQTFLGKASTNRYETDSITNSFGTYGSSFSASSIRNQFSSFGSTFSTYSAYNSFATRPPILYRISGGQYVAQAYLTKNTLLFPRVDPDDLITYLFSLGSSASPTNVILMSGNFSYSYVGSSITFGVNRVSNYRSLGSTSGTLALQLWATSTVYTGGSLFGYKLVESTIGTLQGGFYIDNIVRSGTIASVPSGNYNIVFVLAEWNGTAYVTVDYGNFNDRQNIGIVPVAPAITSQPTGVSAIVGQNVTFTVSASGSSSLSYQWRKNGTDILGATSASYTLSSVQLGDAANYSVVVSNSAGTVTSNNALLSVATPAVAPSITSHPTNQSVTAGTAVVFSVNASGTAPLTYQWRKDGAALAGATSSSLSIASASAANAGTYSVAVSNSAGSVISNSATLTVTEPLFSRIGNVSIRTTLSDRQLLIVGLTMSGGEKPVLVRAVGPGLATFGVNNFMPDPELGLFNGSQRVTGNDNWGGGLDLVGAMAAVGAFPLSPGSKDAAILTPFSGGRTIQVQGSGGGNVLVEAYDAGSGNSPRLTNVSARNLAGSGGDILIAGFSVSGNTSKTVLIRAIGPTLAAFGLTSVLSDPKLEVYSSGSKIAENDDWASTLAPAFAGVGAFPLTAGGKDSAIQLTLSPGGYTVHVTAATGGSGEALLEIYEIP